jgi:hypothetical protein
VIGLILGLGIPVVHLAVWTAFARVLYQRYRIHEVEKANCPNRKKGGFYNHDSECNDCRRVNTLWWQDGDLKKTAKPYGTGDLVAFALMQAFFWWLVLPVYLMVRAVTANPALAPSELKEREAAQRQRIEELEDLNRRLSDALQPRESA